MRSFYLDASALGKRYAPEAGTAVVNHLFTRVAHDRLYVLSVALGEVMSALVRKKNAGVLPHYAYTLGTLDFVTEVVHSPAVNRMVADDHLVMTSLILIEDHSINATDALVLRSALDLVARLRLTGDDLVLVAADQRLLRAAQTEGLATFNPETQSQSALDALLGP